MIYARRYHWQTADPFENTEFLDWFVARPDILAYPAPPDVARASMAAALVDPANIIWSTYSDQRFTGMVFLTDITPYVNARFRFFSLDKDLAGKRKLLRNIIGYCFTELGFHRLSMEVADKVLYANLKSRKRIPVAMGSRLERFARKALGFRFEGETRQRNPELPICISDDWVARQGSRTEQAYFDGEKWYDVVRLRLLASEWVGTGEGDTRCLGPLAQQPSVDSSGDCSAAADPVTPSPSSPKTSSP